MIVGGIKPIRLHFLEELKIIEMKYDLYSSDNMDENQYGNFFNDVINTVNNGLKRVSAHNLNMDFLYSNIICDKPNEDITWEYLQTTDDEYHKFIFAKKVLERCFIIFNCLEDIDLFLDLSFRLQLITNVRNDFFKLDRDEMIYKFFNSRNKRFNTIFKDEVIDLAMDFLKFNWVNSFSDESKINKKSDIRINQEQGFKLVEIAKLILNLKLKKATVQLMDVGLTVEGVPWLE